MTGGFEVYDIANNNITNAAFLGNGQAGSGKGAPPCPLWVGSGHHPFA
jgi:hypothetical protein